MQSLSGESELRRNILVAHSGPTSKRIDPYGNLTLHIAKRHRIYPVYYYSVEYGEYWPLG